LDDIDSVSLERILARKACVDFWLERFAPEEVKFRLCDSMPPEERAKLEPEMRKALEAMTEELASVKWDAESIHDAIYEGSRSRGIEPKVTFTAFYRMLLGKDKGPRLGFFLSTMERAEVLRRMTEALS
jgi:lysyl-tRNA synthetase class 1